MKTKTIFFTIAVSLIISCQANYNNNPRLQLAEEVMNQYPDSALRVLEEMTPQVRNLPKGEQALYYLLLTQALDKNYKTPTTDSLINISIDFFEKGDDSYRKALSYFYKGKIYFGLGDALKTQEYYLKALEFKEQISDYTLLGLVSNHLGVLYSYRGAQENAKEMHLQALNYYTLNNDSTRMAYVLRNLGRVFERQQKVDSAFYYYERALQHADAESAPSILTELGDLYLQNDNLEKALSTIKKSFEFNREEKLKYPSYAAYGRALLKSGLLDSAQYYLEKSAQSNNDYTKSISTLNLAIIEKEKNNTSKYANYMEEYAVLRDTLEKQTNFETLTMMQSMFNYQQIANQNIKLEKEARSKDFYKFLLISSAMFFSLSLVIGILLSINIHNKKEIKIKEAERKYRESQERIKDNDTQISKLNKQLQEEQTHLSEIQKQLVVTKTQLLSWENEKIKLKNNQMEEQEKEFLASPFCINIRENDVKITDNDWKEIQHFIDTIYNDFTYRLRKEYPKITQEELKVCYLIKMQVPVWRMANIMSKTSSGVSKTRGRLYEKLTGEKGNAEKLDKLITGF